jgi:hypothetical protein
MPNKAAIEAMLREQYGFLKRSVQSYSEGHPEEALRIATTIRVLVHETASSKPLLKQITPGYLQLAIYDVPPPKPTRPGAQILQYFGIGMKLIPGKSVEPIIELDGPELQLVTIGAWWNKVTLIFTEANETITFTRKQLLLTLANKEGGAHVDTDLPAAYEKFVIEAPIQVNINGAKSDSIHLARFAAVNSAAQITDCLERNFPSVNK